MTNATVLTILFLAANPQGTEQLHLDQEVREISEGLLRSQHRDSFKLEQKWAVRPKDVQRALLQLNPQIVHFSGHGAGTKGLLFAGEDVNTTFVDADTLANLFKLFADQVKCVILNGCYTEIQAEAIAQHIPYVIGMNKAIGDRAAIDFAVGFYDALGAGRSIEFAYEFGRNAIQMAGIPEHLTPVLKKNPNINNISPQGDSTTPEAILIEKTTSTPHFSKRRIQAKLEDLEEIYKELLNKLMRLKKDYIIEADSEAKYKLEQRIKEYEKQLEEMDREFEHLEAEKSN
ncbi:MAG: CHAT domain-containing protein [Calothrix sp. MO_167.B42]|nr:CHAT domain-containing protein [Calothrix sp. MO_167.B42]